MKDGGVWVVPAFGVDPRTGQWSKAGDGRVFYTVLGHSESTHWNPLFLRHLLAGLQFALGDLEAPAEPL